MRLVPGDAPLARALAVALAGMIPLGLWWLHAHPGALTAAAGPCRLQTLIGVPCPTCGATGALLALAHGDLAAAVLRHPLVTATVMALAAWSVWGVAATLVPRWRRRVQMRAGEGRRLVGIAVVLVAASWLWAIVAGG